MAATGTAASSNRSSELNHGRDVASRSWIIPAKAMAGWILLIVLTAFFLAEAALPFLTWSERSYHRFWPDASWLLAHIVGGSIALIVGPWQFWIARRTSLRSVHRWSGRVYLGGVLLAGSSGLYLAFQVPLPAFGAALFALDVAWMGATAIAFGAIRNRRLAKHRRWMIRSYVLTLAFVSLRFWLLLAGELKLGPPAVIVPIFGWTAWIAPLVMAEILMRRKPSLT